MSAAAAAAAVPGCSTGASPPQASGEPQASTTDAATTAQLPIPDPTLDPAQEGTTQARPSDSDATNATNATNATTSGTTAALDSGTSTGAPGSTGRGSSDSTGGAAPPLDISGWLVVQTNSAREFEIPAGTVLEPGAMVVIGRDATQPQFEAWWGVPLGADVTYFDAADSFPAINGDETFFITDDADLVVDGPSPALALGENMQRINADPPGTNGADWEASINPNAVATPGVGTPSTPAQPALIVTEASDTTGAGAFVYEFVELQYRTP